MKKQLPSLKRLKTLFYSLCLILCVNFGWSQTTVFHETFGTAAVASGYTGNTSTTPSALTYTIGTSTSNTGVMKSEIALASGNGFLKNVTTASSTNAKIYYSAPFSGLLNSNLSSNTGKITWTVNLRTTRVTVMATGLGDTNQYGGVILASTGSVIGAPSTTTGYAVLFTRSTLNAAANTIKLVRMTVGFGSTSSSALTPTLISSADITSGFTNYRSVKVTYDPATATWELFTRDDGASAFADPESGSYTSAGTSTDATYTSTAMSSYGFFSNSTSGTTGMESDNYKIVLDPPASSPSITSQTALTAFNYAFGSGPSASQSTLITGANLSNPIAINTALLSNYEVSLDNFASAAATGTLTVASGSILSIRLKAGLSAGTKTDTITLTSGATTVTLSPSGSVSAVYTYVSGALSGSSNWTPSVTSFSETGAIFLIQSSVTTDFSWTLGTGSKIILGNASLAGAILTIASASPITGIIDIPAASSGSNSLVLQDATTFPTFGALHSTSEVHFQVTPTAINISSNFGKLFIDGNSTMSLGATGLTSTATIQTSLTVASGSTLSIASTGTSYIYMNSGAVATISGTFRTSRQGGFVSFSNSIVNTTSATYTALQFKDAEIPATSLLLAGGTIEFNRGNSATVQIITPRSDYNNLTISDGGTGAANKSLASSLTVSGTLTLYHRWGSTITGAGSIIMGNGATIVRTAGDFGTAPIFGTTVNVTYNGINNGIAPTNVDITSGFEIPTATTVLNNLTIATTTQTVTLNSATAVNNKLTLTSGTLATGGLLTLKSNVTKTAVVAPVAAGITGNVIVERNIPIGHRAYRLLSPATTGGTINANWQEGGLVTTVGGISNPFLTYGTHITGAGGSANGFDTTTSNAASIFTYDNITPAWTALANTSGTLTAGSPYLVYIRGSRLATNIDASLGNDATTLRTTGTLTIGTVPVSGLNATANGFSVVGNPYQAQVDMNKVLVTNATAVNLAPFYYVVDPKLGGKGAYATVDLVTPGLSTAVDANQYLQPGQACFVQTVAASAAALNFTEADKFEGVQTSVFRTKNIATARLLLTLNDASAKALDRLVVAFDASESNAVNQNDAAKLTNFDESMATSNSSKLFAIEKRAIPTDTDEIPLNITKYRGTSYTIKAEGFGLTGSTPYLLDQYANKITEIPQDGSVNYAYTVDAAIPESIAADRFKLIYAKTLKTIDNAVTSFALYPNPSKTNSFSVNVPQSTGKASLTVSNMLGQQLYSQNDLQSGSIVKVIANNVKTAGVYLVSLTSDGKTTTTKWIVE
jgi:hypothetical protein